MTLFIALSEIREKLDPSLQFGFVCRAGICGSCAMLVDGGPALACRRLTKNLGATFTHAWTRRWPTGSMSSTAASNAVAAWPPAARRACARTSSARSG
jgi:hypothetical protein